MSEFFDLAEKRAEHEALKSALVGHGQCLVSCACWHNDVYGVRKLQEKLAHMMLLAERLESTLGDIHRIERAVLSR